MRAPWQPHGTFRTGADVGLGFAATGCARSLPQPVATSSVTPMPRTASRISTLPP